MRAGSPPDTPPGAKLLALVAVLGQFVLLYLPDPSGLPGAGVPGLDKLVHLFLFAVPTWALLRVVRPRWMPVVAMLVQAIGSEFIQGGFLPGRGADPFDLAVDLAGISLGVLAAWRWPAAGGRRG